MGMLDRIKQVKTPQISRQQTLFSQPMQNPNVQAQQRGKGLLLRVRIEQPRASKLAQAVLHLPTEAERKVVLDSIGAEIWKLCDQKNTVADIIELTRRRYKFSHKEALISVTTFLKQLGSKGLIAFAVPKDQLTAEPEQ